MPENPENDPTHGQPATELGAVAAADIEAARLPLDVPPLLVELANPPKPPGDDTSDSFEPDQVLVDGTTGGAQNGPVRVVERQADRIRTTLVNTDADDTVTLFSRAQGTRATGFPLLPGASVTIKTRAAVYAMVPAGAQVVVAVLSEFRQAKAE